MATPESSVPFSIQCPCCQAELRIDPATRTVLHHAPLSERAPIFDLAAEVSRLRDAGNRREETFQRSLAAEHSKGERMDRKFDELLKLAKQDTAKRPIKDIDR